MFELSDVPLINDIIVLGATPKYMAINATGVMLMTLFLSTPFRKATRDKPLQNFWLPVLTAYVVACLKASITVYSFDLVI